MEEKFEKWAFQKNSGISETHTESYQLEQEKDLTKAGFMLWKKGTGDWEKGG